MCEWLSSVEWCDVRLSCGGRTFSAHRAVLASVSLFLRRVLLACPQEETPTFIVLPDFDLDALSLVLYYIYNGEVIVKKHNIHKFFDIIKVLEIFIDQQYLQKIRDSIGDRSLDLCTYQESNRSKSVYNLSVGDSDEHEYVNLRKGERLQDPRLRYSLSDSDLGDKPKSLSWSDIQPSLDNPLAPYRDRQRNSFLRDLYIETYPQNGTVNGLTGGVLAIPNERYRAPTSVLLTNANGKLPSRADDTLSEMSTKTTESTSYIPNIPRELMPCIQDCTQLFGESSSAIPHVSSPFNRVEFNRKILSDKDYDLIRLKKSWLSCYSSQLNAQQYSIETQHKSLLPSKMHSSPSLDLSNARPFLDSKSSSQYQHSQKIAPENIFGTHVNSFCKYPVDKDSSVGSKSLKVFNQVLNSPWCPRLPYDYKPFRRKLTSVSDDSLHQNKEKELATINDSNNNIEESLKPAECDDKNVTNITKDEYKCILCSQVFRSSEALEVHAKRHTAAARYSCAECGKTFSQLRNYKYHMSVHRGTREFAATCTVCGKYFNDRGYLSSHMKIHRNRKEYKCSLCPKSFNQRVAYNMHVRIHTGVKPHVCEECGKAFSRKMLLKQHQRTHSGERPYACPHCEKRFADRSNMTLHLRLHTGIKPFSCSLCPKSFTKKHHLKSHLNFHTGAKPYSCPRCQLAFTQSSNMRTHLKKCSAPQHTTTAGNA